MQHDRLKLVMPTREKNQRVIRDEWVKFICKRLLRWMNSNGHINRQIGTNRLLPVGSLKRASLKEIFGGWICRLRGEGRRLTKKLAMDVCTRMRHELGMEKTIPQEEITRLHCLLKMARKRKLQKPAQRKETMVVNIDEVDTLPVDEDLPSFAKLLHSI